MLKWLLVFAVVYYVYKFMSKKEIDNPDLNINHNAERKEENTVDILVKDPNCNKYIPKEKAVKVSINGDILYFCSLQCAKEYQDKLERGDI